LASATHTATTQPTAPAESARPWGRHPRRSSRGCAERPYWAVRVGVGLDVTRVRFPPPPSRRWV